MGQGSSKEAVLHVQLDSGFYYSGDTVTGSVVLLVDQPTDIKSISVKVWLWLLEGCTEDLLPISSCRQRASLLLSPQPAVRSIARHRCCRCCAVHVGAPPHQTHMLSTDV